MLIEKSATGRSAWVRLFDETSAALRFPFKKEMLSEAECYRTLLERKDSKLKLAVLYLIEKTNDSKYTHNLKYIQLQLIIKMRQAKDSFC